MAEISINVKLGDRTYPLTVAREEEERIRKAVKAVNENIKNLKDSFGVSDSKDLLAMTSLEFASKYMEEVENTSKDDDLTEKILKFEEKLGEILAE